MGADILVSNGGADILLARYTGTGEPVWARSFGDFLDDTALHLEFDGAGDLVLLASLYGDADFGGPPITDIQCCTWNAVVAKFTTDGANTWGTAIGTASVYSSSNALTICPNDDLAAVSGTGLIALSEDGTVRWRDADNGPTLNDVTCREDNDLLAAGYLFHLAVSDVGDGPLGPYEADPSLIAHYDEQGALLAKTLYTMIWSGFDAMASSEATAIQTGPDGEVTFMLDGGGDKLFDIGDGPIYGGGFLLRRYE